jgi:hypothetical protein
MSESDFTRLRSAVEDVAERAPFDAVVERAARRRARRRIVTAGTLVALAVGVVALGQGRMFRTALPPVSTTSTPAPLGWITQLVDLRFGRDAGYALIGYCNDAAEPVCGYQLYVTTDRGRSWQARSVPLPRLLHGVGFSAELRLEPDTDALVVMDSGSGLIAQSTDHGRTFGRPQQLRDGPAIDIVPVGLRPEPEPCRGGSCQGRVLVIDPATGLRHPLTVNPVGVPAGLRWSVEVDGDGVLWAAAIDPARRPRTAYSADRGRTWHALGQLDVSAAAALRLAPLPTGRGAYLLVTRSEFADFRDSLDGVFRLGDPTRDVNWVRVALTAWPASIGDAVALTDGGLLLTSAQGSASPWRVWPNGTAGPLPDRTEQGTVRTLTTVRRGPGKLLYGMDSSDNSVLVSEDDGAGWWEHKVIG